MLVLICLICGALSRIFSPASNFTPVIALTFFGGVYLKKSQALLLPLAIFALTDVVIGFHKYMLFTWGSILLVAAIGMSIREEKKVTSMIAGGLVSVIAFFFISNFSYWLFSGIYTQDISGLWTCYIAALPFLRNTFISTALYGIILFWSYEFVSAKVRDTRLAKVLLTT